MFFDSIAVNISEKDVYKRLGYKVNTELSDKQKKSFSGYIKYGFELAQIKGAGLRLKIDKKSKKTVKFENSLVIKSGLLASFLLKCDEALFIASVMAGPIIEKIKQMQGEDLTGAVLLDAFASEAVDKALGWIQNYFSRKLIREKKFLIPGRISCGYGDFSLKNQDDIYRIMNLKKIGISINRYRQLSPEKAVTAVGGIADIIS
ncbi:MAG TPA: hypothetical protein ENN78_02460 [Candidatus Omnitrophica bacterium]|nr:hypothetical protein [Candidatus Omnitrophota bacterium]